MSRSHRLKRFRSKPRQFESLESRTLFALLSPSLVNGRIEVKPQENVHLVFGAARPNARHQLEVVNANKSVVVSDSDISDRNGTIDDSIRAPKDVGSYDLVITDLNDPRTPVDDQIVARIAIDVSNRTRPIEMRPETTKPATDQWLRVDIHGEPKEYVKFAARGENGFLYESTTRMPSNGETYFRFRVKQPHNAVLRLESWYVTGLSKNAPALSDPQRVSTEVTVIDPKQPIPNPPPAPVEPQERPISVSIDDNDGIDGQHSIREGDKFGVHGFAAPNEDLDIILIGENDKAETSWKARTDATGNFNMTGTLPFVLELNGSFSADVDARLLTVVQCGVVIASEKVNVLAGPRVTLSANRVREEHELSIHIRQWKGESQIPLRLMGENDTPQQLIYNGAIRIDHYFSSNGSGEADITVKIPQGTLPRGFSADHDTRHIEIVGTSPGGLPLRWLIPFSVFKANTSPPQPEPVRATPVNVPPANVIAPPQAVTAVRPPSVGGGTTETGAVKPGIWVIGYPAFQAVAPDSLEMFWHAELLLVPEDITKFRNVSEFNDGMATLGAEARPRLGLNVLELVSDLDRPAAANSLDKLHARVELRQGLSVDSAIKLILEADRRYEDQARYRLFDGGPIPSWNSNSYISGILKAVGLSVPSMPNIFPRWNTPLPIGYFTTPNP